jgi:hypothetical protein
MALPRRALVLLCLLALGLGAAACGQEGDESIQGVGTPGEAFREGLEEELDGVAYNVFITRQLNPSIPPDQAFYKGPDPGEGKTIYGLFLRACNPGTEPERPRPLEAFTIKDSQGNEYKPKPLPRDNDFAYNPRVLNPNECIPAAGSVAAQQSASGAMLLFELPLQTLENRPLELEIEGAYDVLRSERGRLAFELDI